MLSYINGMPVLPLSHYRPYNISLEKNLYANRKAFRQQQLFQYVNYLNFCQKIDTNLHSETFSNFWISLYFCIIAIENQCYLSCMYSYDIHPNTNMVSNHLTKFKSVNLVRNLMQKIL